MKKVIYILSVVFLLSSCTKKEFDGERPDAKLNRLISEYNDLLIGADQGWIGYLFPEGGGGYTFKFKFDGKNRVKMYAAMDNNKANNSKESSYRITADQVVSLYFDTYSYIHELSDPDPAVFGGVVGAGYDSDFEFSFVRSTKDSVFLEGNHNKSELILVRAKSTEGEDYIGKAYTNLSEVDKINTFTNYYNKLKVDNKEYGIAINTDKSTLNFYYTKDNAFKWFSTEFAVSDKGLILRNQFEDGSLVISALNDFNVDKPNNKITLKIGEKDAIIENLSTPFVIDKDAPRRMYIESYTYTSKTALNVAGQRDALNISGFPGFTGFKFIPRFYIDPFDVLFVYFNGSSNNTVGPYFNTEFNAEGVMKFKVQNIIGTNPGQPHLSNIQTLNSVWSNPAGFYVYQTGKNYYDLVSVTDGRMWLRFN